MTDSVESVLQSREEFEKWASTQEWSEPDETKKDDIGRYKYSDVAYGWQAWQASRSALEPMLAENEKLRELLDDSRIWLTHKRYHLCIANDCTRCELLKRYEQALSPSPTPARPYKPLIKSDKKHVHVDLDEFQ